MAMAAVSPRGIFVSPETSLPTGRVHVSVKARKLLTANSARAFGLLCVATFSKSRRLPHCSCKAGRALAPHRSVQIDQDGRHWEAAVSRIGPRLPETIKSIDEAWRTGAGLLRVACFEASSITQIAVAGENLCFGTGSGRIRVVDIRSGARVGEYFIGSHLPSAVAPLLQCGENWNGKPCWGYTPAPDLTFVAVGHRAHNGAIAGLLCFGDLLISCGGNSVCLWHLEKEDLHGYTHKGTADFKSPPLCLSKAESDAVYLGLEDGSVWKFECSDMSKSSVLPPSEAGAVTAVAYQSGTLVVGYQNGEVKILRNSKPHTAEAFHRGRVRHLQFLPRHKASETLFLSAACDGRVCAWSDSGTALWGIRGLRSGLGKRAEDSDLDRLPLDNVSLAADSERLFFSGLVVNPVTPGNTVFESDWRQSRSNHNEVAPACEGVLCMDMAR
ncbi:unnamed protein product [Durusdinium trenchii]|uniref:Uncharacterized protein n=2 Tax=Durusdinium trenchii TaxID=1381693 RepID=A0ABP0KWM6_9DINO